MDFLRISKEAMVCKQTVEASLIDEQQVVCTIRARLIAEAIIDQEGLFNQVEGKRLYETLHMPDESYYQKMFLSHVRHVLSLFLESSHARLRFKQLSFPLANPFVDQLIARSLCKKEEITKRDISLALMIALLTPLRQSVGSCFATAPLMVVQYEQPFFLFEELYNLVTRGFLKRVVDGKEVRIPMSIKTGLGDLATPMGPLGNKDPSLKEALGIKKLPDVISGETIRTYILRVAQDPKIVEEHFKAKTQSLILKCYEYTVASLSDWKTDFANWNMYTSLGLDHNQEGGLGEMLYKLLEEELGKLNEEITQLTEEVYRTEDQIRALEAHMRGASTEDQIRRIKGEIQAKSHHMYVSEDMHYRQIERSKKIAEFFKFIVEQLTRLFPEYFQEVFDSEMVSTEGEILEDRPAGFRLLYKHGRFDPSVWTMIYSEQEYVSVLIEFFKAIENLLFLAIDWEEGKDLIEVVIDKLIHKVQSPEFMERAKIRTAQMHYVTLKESSPRTPWAYESGGSVDTLVSGYFKVVNKPRKVEFKPTKPIDLLVELIEWMKDAPYKDTNRFESDSYMGMLMTSPVHAFVFKPGLEGFSKAWRSNANTFTYVRDEIEGRGRALYHENPLSKQELNKINEIMTPFGMPNTQHFDEMCNWAVEQRGGKTFLAEIVVNLYYKNSKITYTPFADTNWASDLFVFLVNPVTKEVELWRKNNNYFRALPTWNSHFQGKSWSLFLDDFRG